MSLPVMTVVGNLTEDPKSTTTQNGNTRVTFKVIANKRKRDESGNWVDGDTYSIFCSAWGQQAQNIMATFHKGMTVIVSGEIRGVQWQQQDGSTRYSEELSVRSAGPELSYATAQVVKNAKQGQAPQAPFGVQNPYQAFAAQQQAQFAQQSAPQFAPPQQQSAPQFTPPQQQVPPQQVQPPVQAQPADPWAGQQPTAGQEPVF